MTADYAEDGPPIVAGPENVARAKVLVQVLKKATPELGHRAQAEKDGPGSKTWQQIADEFECGLMTLMRAREVAGLKDEPEPRSPDSSGGEYDDLGNGAQPSSGETVPLNDLLDQPGNSAPPGPAPPVPGPAPQTHPPSPFQPDTSPETVSDKAILQMVSAMNSFSDRADAIYSEMGELPDSRRPLFTQAFQRFQLNTERLDKYLAGGISDLDQELKDL